jgi:RNA polymerase sigma factor (sigma-70 family)
MEDAELVNQILNGNENAFRYLVASNQRLVVHVVGRIVRQQEDVEDICQEVFLKVFRKIKKFRGDSRLSTWIATIAYNTSISHIRNKSRKNEIDADDDIIYAFEKSDAGQVQKSVEKAEAKKLMMEMIEKLPVNYRTVLTLFHLEEFSYKEIEEITGMPEGTIKSYLSRARTLLKQKMEQFIVNEKTNIFVSYAE